MESACFKPGEGRENVLRSEYFSESLHNVYLFIIQGFRGPRLVMTMGALTC